MSVMNLDDREIAHAISEYLRPDRFKISRKEADAVLRPYTSAFCVCLL